MSEQQIVPNDVDRTRLDSFLHEAHPELSRNRWQTLIKQGHVWVNNEYSKPSTVLKGGETISFEIPTPEPSELQPENIPLKVLYEDAQILIINKDAGMVVHPAGGHRSGTLVNAILHHCGEDLQGIGGELRPGIVHRLDKNTSGVMVIAKSQKALEDLASQFKARKVRKEYLALVAGVPSPYCGRIETEIGRSRHDRKKMSATPTRGRHAITNYEVIEKFDKFSLLRVRIETGRTHQIRVHLAHIRHPVLGDMTYGGKAASQPDLSIDRQMLHAHRLEFSHPLTGKPQEALAPLPQDMTNVISILRDARKSTEKASQPK